MCMTSRDRQHMRRCIILECDLGIIDRHCKGNIRSTWYTALTVVLVPTFIDCHLTFIITSRKLGGFKCINSIPLRILQPRAETGWIPITWTAQFCLETAGRDSNYRTFVIRDPMALVIIIEL